MQAIDLSILIVNRNGGEILGRCLASVYRHTSGLDFEVIVVDNGSGDGSAERAELGFPQLSMIRNPHNLGFAPAANQGIRAARGEKVLLLNSDVAVSDNAIGEVALFLDHRPRAGIVGCCLVNEDGSYQKSAGRNRNVGHEAAEKVLQFGLRHRVGFLCRLEERRLLRAPRPVAWVSGAFLMARRALIEEIGLLDEGFFLYFEDIDWCARARTAGWQVLYHPHWRVVHTGGGSVAGGRGRETLEYRRSQLRFYTKHYGRGANTRILRVYLALLALSGIVRTRTASLGGRARPQAVSGTEPSNQHRELLRLVLNR